MIRVALESKEQQSLPQASARQAPNHIPVTTRFLVSCPPHNNNNNNNISDTYPDCNVSDINNEEHLLK